VTATPPEMPGEPPADAPPVVSHPPATDYAAPTAPPQVMAHVVPPAGGFGTGVAAAIGAAVIGAIGWAVITSVTNYRIGFVAVGVGFLVGLAIERFGGGDARLPVIGAVVALIGCFVGDMLADAHLVSRDLHIPLSTVLSHPHALWDVYTAEFRFFDAVFYAIAAYEGFRFGARGVMRARAARAAREAA
jgi:hypothetical protein